MANFETPQRVSIIDVVMFSSGGSQHDAARSLHRLSDQCPEVGPDWPHVQCKGRGQRGTCVTVAKGIVDVIMLLVGRGSVQAGSPSIAEIFAWHLLRLHRIHWLAWKILKLLKTELGYRANYSIPFYRPSALRSVRPPRDRPLPICPTDRPKAARSAARHSRELRERGTA